MNNKSLSFALGLPVPSYGLIMKWRMVEMKGGTWSDADIKSFLLGLFIFGKNFIQIKRFLEDKGMGEILSFYYGKFYKSDEHVSKSYAEGRASLQEYIFSLKSTVGLSTLVEAVAIGKDKADLTSFAAKPPKINSSFSCHPCAPTGKGSCLASLIGQRLAL
ncbi:hypothetical protein K1719_031913 [Acacia pycnantha]|nr:hypothetical protein K1719_031913 [Acacia pycnantha]